MRAYQQLLIIIFTAALILLQNSSFASSLQKKPLVTKKVEDILAKVTPKLKKELIDKKFQLGSPIFIRIFKLPAELEVWIYTNGHYQLFKTYPICDFSGYPGPKLQEGDWQSPEGFYSVSADNMNPRSNYHLSFNIGYPNEYDKRRNRSGSNIMVHGNCSSMGCFAMNDYRMEEIYTLAHNALTNSQQSFAVHVFPFRMTADNMKKFQSSSWIGFWRNLKEGFDIFERTRQVPEIQVTDGKYMIINPPKIAMGKHNKSNSTSSPATLQDHQYR